ncbi:MAG: hydantoinase B/oxoprolinase family protein, partial [Armatimonadetes bacterium]
VPACSQGTMNNVALGTDDWTYYETIGGGCGAGNRSPGASGWHSHMTNTANTPAEALELALPLRVWRYELRDGSGGMGDQPGGEGVVREIELLDEQATLSLMTERRSTKPPGAKGGDPGSPGSNRILCSDGSVEALPAKCVVRLFQGDRLLLDTPGGGGWGEQSDPANR